MAIRVRARCDCVDRDQVFRAKGDVFEIEDEKKKTKWLETLFSGEPEGKAKVEALPVEGRVQDSDELDLMRLSKDDLVHVGATRYGLDLAPRLNKMEMVLAIRAERDRDKMG